MVVIEKPPTTLSTYDTHVMAVCWANTEMNDNSEKLVERVCFLRFLMKHGAGKAELEGKIDPVIQFDVSTEFFNVFESF
jgi:hypothetical protein